MRDKLREKWLKDPFDLHYRGELIELGVRVTDAIEQEIVASHEMRITLVEWRPLSAEENDYINSLDTWLRPLAIFGLQTFVPDRMEDFICYLRDRDNA